ncbi:Redoxin domain protein [Desulfobulbus propionicus DSM 2032]|uniref:Redoxin domain protein n=2 Tax=Desulfobulbus propionicus TaxID=894 RepID=A0A7U3YNQ9_DESPD|nr:Redoxin domain protein [Desulfobulbus propionicus DSM 2032]
MREWGSDALQRLKDMKKYMVALRLLIFSVVVFGLSVRVQGAVMMPAFSLPTAIDGAVVTSEMYRGKAMLITFFATWCPPCLQEIPTLKALHARFQPQGFAVVALSVDEGPSRAVAQLVKRAEINYQVLMADRKTTQNFGGVVAIPTSFLVNRNGHVVKKYPGFVPHSLLEKDIVSVL